MPIQRVTNNGVTMYRSENGKLYKSLDEAKSTKKKVGSDGKACWEGYRYQGTKNGKDICVKVKKG